MQNVLMFILIIISMIISYLLIINNNKYDHKKIKSPQNKILFYKLQKQYLNNVKESDIDDLIIFLNKYKKERFSKK